jgi:hypothetical protein
MSLLLADSPSSLESIHLDGTYGGKVILSSKLPLDTHLEVYGTESGAPLIIAVFDQLDID